MWPASHDLNDKSQRQIAAASARGMLVESQGPIWLYGTASQQSTLYQYQFLGAKNVVTTMIQAQSPSRSSETAGRIRVSAWSEDPTPESCPEGTDPCFEPVAVRIVDSSGIHILGAGKTKAAAHPDPGAK